MKNFYVKSIMVLAMIFGMSTTVCAQLYDDLETAQKALDEGVNTAGELVGDDVFMDNQVKDELKKALIVAHAVWDSSRRENLDDINEVMPPLLDAIENAQNSKEEYAVLLEAIEEFWASELLSENDVYDYLDEKGYSDDDDLMSVIDEAVEQWKANLNSTLFLVIQAGGNADMLEALKSGKDMRTILADNDYEIPALFDVVQDIINKATSIVSAKVVEQGDSAEYSLNGMKVSGNYKGLVIKNGKKIIKK